MDLWTAIEIARLLPDSVLWGPKQQDQRTASVASVSETEPWDILTEGSKVFAIENKALRGSDTAATGIPVDMVQLAHLQEVERLVPGLVWFGVPAPDGRSVRPLLTKGSDWGRLPRLAELYAKRTPFRRWHRLVPPGELAAAVGRKSELPLRATHGLGVPLETFLHDVGRCVRGVPVEEFQEMRERLADQLPALTEAVWVQSPDYNTSPATAGRPG